MPRSHSPLIAEVPLWVEFCSSVKVKAAVRQTIGANDRLGIDTSRERKLELMAEMADQEPNRVRS